LNEELYTPQEVADLLKIKKNTVYELIKRGELKCSKIGKQFRIRKDELEEYLNYSNGMIGDYLDELTYPKAEIPLSKGIVICGQDIILEIICNRLASEVGELPILRSYLGSYNGLYAMYQGKVDVATVHLWDGETGEYNRHYVKRMLPGTEYQRIHLVNRMQGFYVQEGNPKQIKGFRDLIRPDITMINREKGSGTRILLDEHLIKLGINATSIQGYEKEVTSHLAGAGAVARGGADVALGNERISKELKGIEFLPIQSESYDLVVKKESTKYSWYQKLVSIINSVDFQKEIDSLSGYDITNMGVVLE
jgi:putative molybdopterin biosynthesis protein